MSAPPSVPEKGASRPPGLFVRLWKLLRRWRHYPYVAYELIVFVFRNEKDWQLMNYGFTPLDEADASDPALARRSEQFALQLYYFVASGASLHGRDLLEIGSGRGGGASYMHRKFTPHRTVGVDFSRQGIAFSQKTHRQNGLSFTHGNAMSLPLEAETFDVIVNIESSHNYPDLPAFMGEVFRVLRPGGTFLYCDVLQQRQFVEIEKMLIQAGFEISASRDIRPEVMEAMRLDHSRRIAIIEKIVPRIFWGAARLFAGTTDSYGYAKLTEGVSRYFRIIARKPGYA